MTHEERVYFIDREVKGLWPQWDATDAELRVWKDSLAPFDYVPARAAIQACFREQAVNYQRPVLSKFLAHLRAQSRRAAGPAPAQTQPMTEVFLECLEPPRDKPHLTGARKPVSILPNVADPERLRDTVDPLRVRFEQLYGGRWVTVLTAPRPDDGLRGEPARRRAYDRILTGPDTPARRCLQSLSGPAEPVLPRLTYIRMCRVDFRVGRLRQPGYRARVTLATALVEVRGPKNYFSRGPLSAQE